MAQPTPYERDYDFESFQSTHPETPLPGEKVNAEFDAIQSVIDSVLARIAILQRDDLALANRSVGRDQLKTEISLGFNAPSAWTTATAYTTRDTVFHEDAFYICLTAHTSGTFSADLSSSFWELVADFAAATAEAEAAQAAAEAAQAAAELAQSAAVTSAGAAATSASAASGSATTATTKATEAAASALAAQGSATSADSARSAAEGFASDAASSAADAENAKIAAEAAQAAAELAQSITEAALAGKQDASANLTALAGLTSAANKVPYFTGSGTAGLLDFEDEDDMASDSATAVPSQQSVKFFTNAKQTKFASKTEAAAFALASPNFITLTGRDATGDMRGDVRMKKVVSEPSHPGKLQLGSGAWYELYGDRVSPLFWGEPGLGVTADDTLFRNACLAAAGIGAEKVVLKGKTYKFGRNIGTDDRWGAVILESNLKILGQRARAERFEASISSYALAYPILFVGTPDSNSSDDIVENVHIQHITFVGLDTRHSSQGSSLHDFRLAIEFKNTNETALFKCEFEEIDSQAVRYQHPRVYNYDDSRFYNTTLNTNARIEQCRFNAVPHAELTRAKLHAVVTTGVIGFKAFDNEFFWCDDCFNGETTFASELQAIGTTWDPTTGGYDASWSLGAIPRTGRDWTFQRNRCVNSSEHSFYLTGMDVDVSFNTIEIESSALGICTSSHIKVQCATATVIGNRLMGVCQGISLQQNARNMVVMGNTIRKGRNTASTVTGGMIDFSTSSMTAWYDARPWHNQGYLPISNIQIIGNTVDMPTDKDTSSVLTDIGARIQTDSSDANYPNGQIQNVTYSGNIFRNVRWGAVFLSGSLVRNISFLDNQFYGKPFTRTSFDGSDLLSDGALAVNSTGASALVNVNFDNNRVEGFAYLFGSTDGSGSSISPAWGVRNNTLIYLGSLQASVYAALASSTAHGFTGNGGNYCLDRAWGGNGIGNNLSGSTNSTNERRRYTFTTTGSAVRFYTDDAGTFLTL